MRYDAKKDTNQTPIVEELRARGFDVDIIHRLKKMFDILVSGVAIWSGSRSVAVRVEIKMPGEELTPGEIEYWDKQKHGGNLIIAESAEDVLTWFGL